MNNRPQGQGVKEVKESRENFFFWDFDYVYLQFVLIFNFFQLFYAAFFFICVIVDLPCCANVC